MNPIEQAKEALLPCPFCGGEPYRDHDPGYGWWTTGCRSCPCLMTEANINSAEEADAAWNRRAALEAEQSGPRARHFREAFLHWFNNIRSRDSDQYGAANYVEHHARELAEKEKQK